MTVYGNIEPVFNVMGKKGKHAAIDPGQYECEPRSVGKFQALYRMSTHFLLMQRRSECQ